MWFFTPDKNQELPFRDERFAFEVARSGVACCNLGCSNIAILCYVKAISGGSSSRNQLHLAY